MRDTSLVFIQRKDGAFLLARKRRGLGVSKWNGFGGKIEKGETMKECAIRELREESHLEGNPDDLEERGRIYFEEEGHPEWNHWGFIYILSQWKGTPYSSEEMIEPKWFFPREFPYEDMWKADKIWIPMVIEGKKIKGRIVFKADGDTVASAQFEEVHHFDDLDEKIN